MFKKKKIENPKIENVEYALKKVDVVSTLYDSHGLTKITQEYVNETLNSQEIEINISLGKDIVLRSLTAILDDQVMTSKIYLNETAQEKYTDSISSGNSAILGSTNELDPDDLTLILGNLLPGKKIKVDFELIHRIQSEDLSYRFCLPLDKIPKFQINEKVLYNIQPALISKPTFAKVPFSFSAVYNSPSKITRFICPSHQNLVLSNCSEDFKIFYMTINEKDLFKNNQSEIVILFRNEDLNTTRIYEEYDPALKKYSYLLNYKLDEREYPQLNKPDTDLNVNYFKQYEEECINDSSASFIFLLDQSGSMRGESITTAKEALKLFIKSLPPGCEFSVIGFGTDFVDYTKILNYNKKNVNDTLIKIDKLQADLQQTNILSPLEYIYANTAYNKSFAKNVFLLTDGCVDNSIACVDLIRENNKSFRVHSLGIGNSVSKPFITQCGEVGKGSYEFAVELKEITKKVIKALNSALKNYYSDFKFEFSTGIQVELENGSRNYDFVYQDDVVSYGFISNERIDLNSILSVTAKSQKENKICKQFIVGECLYTIGENNILNKFIAGFVCKNNNEAKEKVITVSKLYQVISKETSLFVELENTEGVINSGEIVKIKIPVTKRTLANNNYKQPLKVSLAIPEVRTSTLKRSIMTSSCSSSISESKKDVRCSGKDSKCYIMARGLTNTIVKAAAVLKSKKFESEKLKEKDIEENDNEVIETSQLSREEMIILSPKIQLSRPQTALVNKKPSHQSIKLNEKMKASTTNTQKDSKKQIYEKIINCQEIEGYWSENNDSEGVLKHIISTNKSNIETLLTSEKIKSISDQDLPVVATILIIWYLYTNYADLKDEYCIIANKAKKYLLNNGINYTDYAKLLN